MPTIVRNPEVEDNIVEATLRTEADVANVRRLYEDGKLVYLSDTRFDVDYDFLNSLDFDVDGPAEHMKAIKKFGGKKIAAIKPGAITDEFLQFVYDKVFLADEGRLKKYKAEVKRGNEQSEAIIRKVFPTYEFTKIMPTWRFTRTMFENLHWDNFKIEDHKFQQVRVFTNMAPTPRIWRTHDSFLTYCERHYEEHGLARFAGQNADRMVRHINNNVIGGQAKAPLDNLPKTHIAWEQGDVWLAETRVVSHQIYIGEKAFASMNFANPETMERPEQLFDHRVERLHKQMGGLNEDGSIANAA